MANHTGSEGVVKVGSNAVAEVRSFDINQQASTTEDTVIGDAWETHKATQKRWDASLEVFWDESDATGQGALTIGSEVSVTLGPEGTTTGDTTYSGTAIVTDLGLKVTHNGMVEASVKLKGTGALSIATAS